jgi:hypothetical protein
MLRRAMHRCHRGTAALLLAVLFSVQSTVSNAESVVETIVGPSQTGAALPPGAPSPPPLITKGGVKGGAQQCVQIIRVASGQATFTSRTGQSTELGPNTCACVRASGEVTTYECTGSILPLEMADVPPPPIFIPPSGFTPPPCVSQNSPRCR